MIAADARRRRARLRGSGGARGQIHTSKGVGDMGAGRNASRLIGTLAVIAMIGAATGGCQSKLADENKQLWSQNRELQSKYAEAQNAPKSDPAETAQLQ